MAQAKSKGGRPVGLHHQYISNLGVTDAHGRRSAECAFCDFVYVSMRPEQVWSHVIDACKSIPSESSEQAVNEAAAKGGQAPTAPAAKRPRPTSSTKDSSSSPSLLQHTPMSGNVTPALQTELDSHFLRALVHSGVAFNVAENPYLVHLLQTLRPKWAIPGRTKLACLLISEDAHALLLIKQKIGKAEVITITIDGWTTEGNQSVYAVSLTFSGPDGRTTGLYDAVDFSEERHTAEFIAGALTKWAEEIGVGKLAAIVTDNAANMVKARGLFVSQEGMGHILAIRCHMHAFNLGLESVVSGQFAKDIAVQGQQVATFVRASPRAAAAVAQAAKALKMTGTVLSGNATRFTSVIRMLDSLQRLKPALADAVQQEPSAFKPAVAQILTSRDFWDDLAALLPILEPFATAITTIQGTQATLSDVLLQWLRLGAAIKRNLTRLPAAFRSHVIAAFNRRCLEMDSPLHHLALFLDPRYKTAAAANGQLPKLVETAKAVMKERIDEPLLDQLVSEITAYSNGSEPFAPSYLPSAALPVRSWWMGIHNGTTASVIVTLAVLLFSIVPHAAGNERDFSIMKWLNAPRRASQTVATLRRLARVRGVLNDLLQPPRRIVPVQDEEVVPVELTEQFLEDLEQPVQGAALVPEQLSAALDNCHEWHLNAEAVSAAEPVSFTELLLSDYDLLSPTWQPGFVPDLTPVSASLVGLNLSRNLSCGPRVVTRGFQSADQA